MYSILDFDFVHTEGFEQTFFYIERAMDKYHKDSTICCMLFRQALESAITDIYTILEVTIPSNNSIKYRADHIKQIIPDEFYDDKLYVEIDNIRIIGNRYNHVDENETQEPNKDKKTCYLGMQYICRWIINFSKEYPSYLLEREKQEEEDKQLTIITIIITIISLLALLFGLKKSE